MQQQSCTAGIVKESKKVNSNSKSHYKKGEPLDQITSHRVPYLLYYKSRDNCFMFQEQKISFCQCKTEWNIKLEGFKLAYLLMAQLPQVSNFLFLVKQTKQMAVTEPLLKSSEMNLKQKNKNQTNLC